MIICRWYLQSKCIGTLELMWPWSVNGAKPTKRHQTHCWSIIGPKLLVGIFTDQQYCTYNVQYHRCLYLPTNNIAPSTCKHFARWRCKMLLILGGAVGSLTVGSWQLAVGSWLLAAGSCLDNLILLLYWDIRTRNSKVRRDILTHQTDIHKLQIYIWLSLLVDSLFC